MGIFHANGAPRLGMRVMLEPDNGTPPAGNNGENENEEESENDGEQDAAKLLEALKKERSARRAAERELKPLKSAAQQRADAEKSASDKANDRIAALEKQLADSEAERRQVRVIRAVRDVDRRLGLALHDPEVVADLLRLDEADFDDDGKPSVEAKLKQLVKDKPFLAGARRPGGGDAGTGGGKEAAADMNTLIRRAAGR